MVPRKNRLKNKKEFEKVFKNGEFFGGQYCTIRMLENKFSVSRFGFVAGKKLIKSIVRRNKVKRRMREIVRLFLRENKIKPGFDVITIAKERVLDVSYQELKKDLEGIFKRVKLLTSNG